MDHKSIVKLIGSGHDGQLKKENGMVISGLTFLILEYISGGELFHLCQYTGQMSEQKGLMFLSQMINVVQYLHKQGIVHRDLKLENFLVDNGSQLKLTDFGFSTSQSIKKLNAFYGTKVYMAPEVLNKEVHDGRPADVFQLGVMLFIIVVGGFPFQNASMDDDFYTKLCDPEQRQQYWKKITNKQVSQNFKSLIAELLHPSPKQRIKLGNIKDHPWCVAGISKKKAAPLRTEGVNTMQDKTLHEGGLKNTIQEMTYEEGQSTERMVGGLELNNIAIGVNLQVISEAPEGQSASTIRC